jgi:hypothetical protein
MNCAYFAAVCAAVACDGLAQRGEEGAVCLPVCLLRVQRVSDEGGAAAPIAFSATFLPLNAQALPRPSEQVPNTLLAGRG